MFGVAENIKILIDNSVEKWRVLLCAGNSDLGEVHINSLSAMTHWQKLKKYSKIKETVKKRANSKLFLAYD